MHGVGPRVGGFSLLELEHGLSTEASRIQLEHSWLTLEDSLLSLKQSWLTRVHGSGVFRRWSACFTCCGSTSSGPVGSTTDSTTRSCSTTPTSIGTRLSPAPVLENLRAVSHTFPFCWEVVDHDSCFRSDKCVRFRRTGKG
eukprot:2026461-Rhodomonas_salina.2